MAPATNSIKNGHPRRHRGEARRDPGRHRHHHRSREERPRPVLVVLGIGVVIVAFLLGRRRGHKRSTIVEVRRV